MKQSFLKRYIGDWRFYKMVLSIAVPVMIQNGITNFVSLLDNIMVGRVGTNEMTGVASANQLIFVFNLCVFGAVSGAGIFTAQFFGKGDHKGVAHTMRFKLYIVSLIVLVGILIFSFFGQSLIHLYLQGEGSPEDALASLNTGVDYLHVMLIGLIPFVIVQCYAGTLRETGETLVPMLAGIVAVLVNLFFNYILIFGHFGFPCLGARGAAIATVISRFAELVIVLIWTHTHTKQYPFASLLYRGFSIPAELTKNIIIKGMPLMVNEFLWSFGMASLIQCYSLRGLHVVAAFNISSTISNVFNVVYLALGSSVSIIIGQLLGAGKMEEAVETDRKMITFAVLGCFGVGILLFLVAPLFPLLYNTTEDVRVLAANLIRTVSCFMPVSSFLNACYFTLRSGGKTIITLIFDSGMVICLSLPAAFLLVHFSALPIVPLYACVLGMDIVKSIIGYIFVKKRLWVHNIIE